MQRDPLSRRAMLRRTGLLLGTAGVLAGLRSVSRVAAAPTPATESRTPPLSKEAMAALDTALGGKRGSYIENEGVYTTPLPRNDLKVTIKGEPVPIAFGFGGWVSLKRTLDGQGAMLMSDTVLLEEEVNPLISAVQDRDLKVTAIHNHFFYESPRIFICTCTVWATQLSSQASVVLQSKPPNSTLLTSRLRRLLRVQARQRKRSI